MHIISIAFDFTEYTRISRVYKRVYECICEYIHMCSFVHVHESRSSAYFGGPGRFVMNFFINYFFFSLFISFDSDAVCILRRASYRGTELFPRSSETTVQQAFKF